MAPYILATRYSLLMTSAANADPLRPTAPPVVFDPGTAMSPEWTHGVVLLSSLAVIAAAAMLVVVGDDRVAVVGLDLSIPGYCLSRTVLHLPCPGCGLTRSFACMAHGEWLRAALFNPAGPVMFLFIALQAPFRAVQIWRLRQGLEPLGSDWVTVGIYAVAALLIGQWMVRLIVPAWFLM